MARPERKNVDYFPHPCKAGKKMAFIKHKYGNEGYAVWYQLLEQLGDAEDHYLNLGKNSQKMLVLGEIGCDETTLFNVIDDLIVFEVFHEKLWKKKQVLYSQKFVDSIKDVYSRRNTNCIGELCLCRQFGLNKRQKQQVSGVNVDGNPVNADINTQTKLNQTKLNQTKPNYLQSIDDFLETDLTDWFALLEKQYPELDIGKTLRNIIDYWRTDEGYQNKLKSKTKKIDWKATFKNGFNKDWNKVTK